MGEPQAAFLSFVTSRDDCAKPLWIIAPEPSFLLRQQHHRCRHQHHQQGFRETMEIEQCSHRGFEVTFFSCMFAHGFGDTTWSSVLQYFPIHGPSHGRYWPHEYLDGRLGRVLFDLHRGDLELQSVVAITGVVVLPLVILLLNPRGLWAYYSSSCWS